MLRSKSGIPVQFAIPLLFLLIPTSAFCAKPTLARLSFWVPPERKAEFARDYQNKVLPFLQARGFQGAKEESRPTQVDSVFSRLFAFANPAAFNKQYNILFQNPEWRNLNRELGRAYISPQSTWLHYAFNFYCVPNVKGTVVPADHKNTVSAGSGKGRWRLYDESDGLPGTRIRPSAQDREGNLWFRTTQGAVRFDGRQFTLLTTEDGLVGNRIDVLFTDRDGNLWFGTRKGVSRYDGQHFVNFTEQDGLVRNRIITMFQDRDGYMWFGTSGGLSRFDGQKFKNWTMDDGLSHSYIRAIFQDREGDFWIGTTRGINRYDGRTIQSWTPPDGLPYRTVSSIAQGPQGHIWIATGEDTDGAVCTYDPSTTSSEWIVVAEQGLSEERCQIYSDRKGNLWFGTRHLGIIRFDGQKFTQFLDKGDRATDIVGSKPYEDRQGRLWFSTRGGVRMYDGRRFRTLTADDGLANELVSGIFQDRSGRIWFGHGIPALSRYTSESWTTFTTRHGLAGNDVWDMTHDAKGNLWFSNVGGGATRYDGQSFTIFTDEEGLIENLVHALFRDHNDHIWIGMHEGTSRYDGQNFTHFSRAHGLPNNHIWGFGQDADNNHWFGTGGGYAIKYDGQSFEIFGPDDGLDGSIKRRIYTDREGTLYLISWIGQVFRYDGQTFTRLFADEGLPGGRINRILRARDGQLWLATTSGAIKYNGKNSVVLTTEDGLAHNRVNTIFQDSQGHLWFGTRGGVSRYDGKTFVNLTTRDGLTSNQVYEIVQDPSGQIWFATNNGVSRYRQTEIPPPTISIHAVVADKRYGEQTDLSISSSAGLIAFEFDGISQLTHPETLVFRYRLNEFDPIWKTTSSRRVEYTEIPRGNYTFEVQTVDHDLQYSKTPATIALTVHLPYERIGLISTLGIAITLVAWQTARVVRRDRRLQETNKAMSEANKELFQANQALQRDRAVERIRGEVQAMEQASDFEGVLSVLAEDLKTVGLSFDTCGIDVLDEPVEEPTMAYFEEQGFQYTTYTIDPEGNVTDQSYHVPAPFPEVIQEKIERFIEGKSWQGRSEQTAILEVPASSYGRLRITSPERQDFTEGDIEALQDFASAIALGYARYLDIREIQEQTERKSRFLADMSHELRTPMNAIIGFTRMVLRRSSDVLPDRQKDNLHKVTQSADHLLGLINSLLDLSKIEAGRMDVQVERFDVKNLIAGCCAEVEPLVEAKPGLKLGYTVSEDAGEANTDPGRLRQIVINLLSNAIKFTDQGDVAVRVSKDGRATEASLVLAVSDTGTGIPPDALDSIFEEFRQVEGSDPQHKGTGLGLPITKGFAELLGGSISVQSQVGKGSTFMVRVPVVYEEG